MIGFQKQHTDYERESEKYTYIISHHNGIPNNYTFIRSTYSAFE